MHAYPDVQVSDAQPPDDRCASSGFTLVELLIALLLGCVLSGMMLQFLLSESRSGQRLARLLRERQGSERVLELISSELQQASAVSVGVGNPAGLVPACNLAGRALVLQLQTEAGVISYSQGAAPDPIWRGQVLMRCGPAYGLNGTLSAAGSQNRVVIDALLTGRGVRVGEDKPGIAWVIELQQELQPGHILRQQVAARL